MGQLQTAFGIAPNRTVIAGFSQGSILSARVALSAPECVACCRAASCPSLEPHVASQERLAKLHGFIGHGQYDSKLPVAWAQRSDRLLDELPVSHLMRLYPIDHAISPAMQADFVQWLQEVGLAV